MAEGLRPPCGDTNTGCDIPEVPLGHQIVAGLVSARSKNGEMIKVEGQGEPHGRNDEYPSSLRSSSTCTSYSLEISLSTNDNSSKVSQPLPLQTPPESGGGRGKQTLLCSPMINHSGGKSTDTALTTSHRPSTPTPLQNFTRSRDSIGVALSQCTDQLGSCQIITSKNTNAESSMEQTFSSPPVEGKLEAHPILTHHPKLASSQSLKQEDSDSKESKVSEEETFYAFVILHAPEDADEAVRIKDRLESVSNAAGATFSEDFAEPGRSTFRCVEDAIHNSALVMLLLTSNFKTHLNETSADAALLNSIEKPHKYNTVIPLLPRENGLRGEDFPLVLRSKNPLDEKGKAFETMAKKVLAPCRIQKQRKIWKEECLVQKQRNIQQSLREENRRHMDFNREAATVRGLEQQRLFLLSQQQQYFQPPMGSQPFSYPAFMNGPPHFGPVPFPWPLDQSGASFQQPASNIHIQNAKYIMIGNDSSMTVRGGANNSEDEDCT